jgi:hypothetical protein
VIIYEAGTDLLTNPSCQVAQAEAPGDLGAGDCRR